MFIAHKLRLFVFLGVACLTWASSQTRGVAAELGGPEGVVPDLEAAETREASRARLELIENWAEWKKGIRESSGLTFGFTALMLYQNASDVLPETDDEAAGGIYRFQGSWVGVDRGGQNPGRLEWRLEHRSSMGSSTLAPTELGGSIGAGALNPAFAYSDGFDTDLSVFNWTQLFNDGRAGFAVGRLAFDVYQDAYAFQTISKGFLNRAFIVNPSAGTTGIGALGGVVKGFVGDSIWLGAQAHDANAVSGDFDWDTVEESEWLSAAEIGWSPSIERYKTDRIQLTYWHKDAREVADVEAGEGWLLSASWQLAEQRMVFFRAGHSDGGGGVAAESAVSLGGECAVGPGQIVSLGLGWAEPAASESDDDEILVEASYRVQLTPTLSMMPDVQYIKDPSKNPEKDNVWVGSTTEHHPVGFGREFLEKGEGMKKRLWMIPVPVVLCFGAMMPAHAEDGGSGKAGFKKKSGDFAGPQSTVKQLEEDDALKEPLFRFDWFDPALKPWFDLKGAFAEKSNISIGLAYTALYQESDVAPDGVDDVGASGIVRLSGRWAATDTGTLVFSGDHRHAYDEQAPADLGFAVGYLGIPGTLFSDAEEVLVDFHWQQGLNDGDSGIILGRYDPNDFFDVLGYANPWTSFQNLAVLFNSSIALPDASIGVGGGHWLNDQMYVLGTINDANGVVTETDAFEGGSEFYKAIELGWTPAKDQRYFNKIHVMGWHADEREDAGLEESYGFTVSANRTWDQRCMVFGKIGWSDGAAPLANESVTLGFMHYVKKRSDLLGLAVNWSDPADDSLKDQTVGELFYRLQFAQNLALTPSVQFVQDPALNEDEDQIVITSVRARLTL